MASKIWEITPEKFLTHSQVAQLLKSLEDKRDLAIARNNRIQDIKDYYIIRGILETGLRCFEFCALKNKHLLKNKVFVKNGKGGKSRTVILTRETSKLLRDWLSVKEKLGCDIDQEAPLFPSRNRKHYSTRGIQKRVEICFKEAELPSHLSTHSLRHTYCCFLMESRKVGLATIRNNMGHSSIQTTNIYSHASENLDGIEIFGTSDFFNKSEQFGKKDKLTDKNPIQSFLEMRTKNDNF